MPRILQGGHPHSASTKSRAGDRLRRHPIDDRAEAPSLQTNRPQLDQSGPNCGRVRFLFDFYSAASSILVGVICSFPSTSFTVPVAVTFLVSLQSLPWNSLLTSLATK